MTQGLLIKLYLLWVYNIHSAITGTNLRIIISYRRGKLHAAKGLNNLSKHPLPLISVQAHFRTTCFRALMVPIMGKEHQI